jgi:hypothetical protein
VAGASALPAPAAGAGASALPAPAAGAGVLAPDPAFAGSALGCAHAVPINNEETTTTVEGSRMHFSNRRAPVSIPESLNRSGQQR